MRALVRTAIAFTLAASVDCSSKTPLSSGTTASESESRRQLIQQQEAMVSEEAQARRKRSIAVLKVENVPFIDALPVIEDAGESARRQTDEVAMRAMALCIVAVKGEGLEQRVVDQLVQEYGLASVFTPKEASFIADTSPLQHERTQFSWRYECYWVMLWALGYVEDLGRPDAVCDVKVAVSLLRDSGREGFLEKAKLRPQGEILDAADLIYRYHWSVVDARVNGRGAPAGLDGGVVMERHHALNWLIGYMDQAWDDVSTDT